MESCQILLPLYELATKDCPGLAFRKAWKDNNLEVNYNEAKEMLSKACQMAHPDPTAPIAITSDASKTAVGAVLEQYEDGAWRPLGFWSQHLKEDKQ